MSFDPNMTYWQSLRIVARGLVQSPFRKGDLRYLKTQVGEISECLLAIGATVGGWILRITATIVLPISAPLLTWLVQVERRKAKAAKQAAKERAHRIWGG